MSNTPSDAEIEKLAAEHLKAFAQFTGAGDVWVEGEVAFARAVLAKWAAPQPAPAPLSESIDQVERALAIIGVVGAIDGHDVVRRESVLEIARRAALAAQGGKE